MDATPASASSQRHEDAEALPPKRKLPTSAKIDDEVARQLKGCNKENRRLFRHAEHCESKRMRAEDDRAKLVEFAARADHRAAAAEEAAEVSAQVAERKREPLFRAGQSVHHFWASWFPKCGPGQHPKKYNGNKRPHWFSSEVNAVCGWMDNVPYAGTLHSGFMYLVY
jgi:hypothetical protein